MCVCVPVSVLRCDTPAGPGPRQSFNLKITELFACKHHSDVKITDKNIKTDLLAEKMALVMQNKNGEVA